MAMLDESFGHQTLNFKIIPEKGHDFHLQITDNTPFSAIMSAFCETNKCDESLMKFLFDGEVLQPHETPSDFGMVDCGNSICIHAIAKHKQPVDWEENNDIHLGTKFRELESQMDIMENITTEIPDSHWQKQNLKKNRQQKEKHISLGANLESHVDLTDSYWQGEKLESERKEEEEYISSIWPEHITPMQPEQVTSIQHEQGETMQYDQMATMQHEQVAAIQHRQRNNTPRVVKLEDRKNPDRGWENLTTERKKIATQYDQMAIMQHEKNTAIQYRQRKNAHVVALQERKNSDKGWKNLATERKKIGKDLDEEWEKLAIERKKLEVEKEEMQVWLSELSKEWDQVAQDQEKLKKDRAQLEKEKKDFQKQKNQLKEIKNGENKNNDLARTNMKTQKQSEKGKSKSICTFCGMVVGPYLTYMGNIQSPTGSCLTHLLAECPHWNKYRHKFLSKPLFAIRSNFPTDDSTSTITGTKNTPDSELKKNYGITDAVALLLGGKRSGIHIDRKYWLPSQKSNVQSTICRRVCDFLLSIHEDECSKHQCFFVPSDKISHPKHETEIKLPCQKSIGNGNPSINNRSITIKPPPNFSQSSNISFSWQRRSAIAVMKNYLTYCDRVFENIESVCEKDFLDTTSLVSRVLKISQNSPMSQMIHLDRLMTGECNRLKEIYNLCKSSNIKCESSSIASRSIGIRCQILNILHNGFMKSSLAVPQDDVEDQHKADIFPIKEILKPVPAKSPIISMLKESEPTQSWKKNAESTPDTPSVKRIQKKNVKLTSTKSSIISTLKESEPTQSWKKNAKSTPDTPSVKLMQKKIIKLTSAKSSILQKSKLTPNQKKKPLTVVRRVNLTPGPKKIVSTMPAITMPAIKPEQNKKTKKQSKRSFYQAEFKSRTKGLSTPISSGRGFDLMKKMGWSPGEGAGTEGQGRKTPVPINFRRQGQFKMSKKKRKRGKKSQRKESDGITFKKANTINKPVAH